MYDPQISVILAGVVLSLAMTLRYSRPRPGAGAPTAWRRPAPRPPPGPPKPLLDAAARRLHGQVARLLPPGHHLLARVPYGDVLAGTATAAFDRQRTDLVICDAAFRALAVVERRDGTRGAAEGEAIRRAACAQAGLPLVVVPAGHDSRAVAALLAPVIGRRTPEGRAAAGADGPTGAVTDEAGWWSRGESNP